MMLDKINRIKALNRLLLTEKDESKRLEIFSDINIIITSLEFDVIRKRA